METINANTKISWLLKQHPGALEAIISISPKFNKLRNPFLRKMVASRATISMASKIAGCSINDFFNKLRPLGFSIDQTPAPEEKQGSPVPAFMKNASKAQVVELDVRPEIEAGRDPLNLILKKIKPLQTGQILKLINSFEPVPLMLLLGGRGFETYSEKINGNLFYTYFHKAGEVNPADADANPADGDWDSLLHRFKGNIKSVDVRQLEMPMPMHVILEELDKLPANTVLFVYHKRIPVFLLPELKERKFDYRMKEINDSEVHMLIYKE